MKDAFYIGGNALSAFMVRVNTIASNLANSGTVASSEKDAFRALKPVFKTVYSNELQESGVATIEIEDIVESKADIEKRYSPGHKKADPEGYIYVSNVQMTDEIVDLIETRHHYQNMVQAMSSAKSLMSKTISAFILFLIILALVK